MVVPKVKLPKTAKAYLVGGAVRDELLGIGGGDEDFVVVGTTPEEMDAAGFVPVGGDFPVFVHPQTGGEYALARTERKSGRGYKGFVFYTGADVGLQDDLRRRDLTINAIAKDDNGKLIDPFGGVSDIRARVLRHVSPAFAEDPVRILRAARFVAALPGFVIAAETETLMTKMTANGEAAHLRPERVWRELARGLTTPAPSVMIKTLHRCGALSVILPEVAALDGIAERLDYHPEGDSFVHTMMVLDAAAARGCTAVECFGALLHDTGKAQTPADILPKHYGHEARSAVLARAVCARLKVPNAFLAMAVLTAAEHGNVHKSMEMRAAKVTDLLARLGAFRRRAMMESVLRVCEADFYYLPERADKTYPQSIFLRAAADAACRINGADIASTIPDGDGKKIAAAIRNARICAVRAVMDTIGGKSQNNNTAIKGGGGSRN